MIIFLKIIINNIVDIKIVNIYRKKKKKNCNSHDFVITALAPHLIV